jgi:hypothetical protein
MPMSHLDLEARGRKYAALSGITLDSARPLGDGTDGKVWMSDKETAVKVLERMVGYYNERDTYLRLEEYGITEKIEGFWIPRLIGYDDELWVIEMQAISNTPYIIDFAKVRIDRPPDFSDEVVRDAHEKGREEFAHHWPEVCQLLATLESFGIYYLDARPSNIDFADL